MQALVVVLELICFILFFFVAVLFAGVGWVGEGLLL